MDWFKWFKFACAPCAEARASRIREAYEDDNPSEIFQSLRREADRFHALTEEEQEAFIGSRFARKALRWAQEEGARGDVVREEEAVGKKGRISPDMVSRES
jgi:hypothetical protein